MTRRHGWSLLLCFLTGCSMHPLTDFWDYVHPGKLYPNKVEPYGGVAIPQGPILPAAQNPLIAPAFPGGVVPPPAPLPGSRPAGIELQPPLPPPPPPRSF